MRRIAPAEISIHRPFRIGTGPSDSGPRLGGTSPTTLCSRIPTSATYILTFPLVAEPDLYASLYQTCTFAELIHALNGPHQSDERIMAILHLDLPRSADYLNASALSAHPLLLMPEAPDVEHNGEGGIEIVEAHKFGGRPYCVQEPELEGVDELLRRGYFQALQLAFPGARNDARVSGNWPFGDGIFNLFWKEPFESTRPIWYLQG